MREWVSHLFHAETFGTWGGTRNSNGNMCTADGIANSFNSPWQWSMSDQGQMCLERRFLDGFSFHGESQVLGMITNNDQYAQQGNNGFRIDFESGPHDMVHGIIAGQKVLQTQLICQSRLQLSHQGWLPTRHAPHGHCNAVSVVS